MKKLMIAVLILIGCEAMCRAQGDDAIFDLNQSKLVADAIDVMGAQMPLTIQAAAPKAVVIKGPLTAIQNESHRKLVQIKEMIRQARAEAEKVEPSIGVEFGLLSGGVFVSAVHKQSPAAAAGVKPGMMLLSVDGKDVTGLSGALAMEHALKLIDETPVPVTMRFADAQKRVYEFSLEKKLLRKFDAQFADRWSAVVKDLDLMSAKFSEEAASAADYLPLLPAGRLLLHEAHRVLSLMRADIAVNYYFNERPSETAPAPGHSHAPDKDA